MADDKGLLFNWKKWVQEWVQEKEQSMENKGQSFPIIENSVSHEKYSKMALLAISGVTVVIIGAFLNPFHVVPTGSRGVITQFGKIVGVANEGLSILPPWQRLYNFSVRAERSDINGVEGSTSDTQPVSVSLTVRYSIFPSKVTEVFEKYSHNGNLSSYVETATQEVFKVVTARYTATDLIAQRTKVSNEIAQSLKKKLSLYGAQVINIDMRNFSFSSEYMAAINDKVTQEQKRLAAENRLRTVEAEQKQKVAIAEAESKALLLQAEAWEKSKNQSKEIIELKRLEVELEAIKKWDGKLPQNMMGSAAPFIGMNIGTKDSKGN